jgi:GT2 family glycosyltransferase
VSSPIEIIVPIFRGADELSACLPSLERTLAGAANVTLQLVDDYSEDPRVDALLDEYAAKMPVPTRVHRNTKNLGFVGNVNTAMARTDADVVLLNADTITTKGWLERLRTCVASDSRIATATPFSNNAEICSFPDLCVAATIPSDPDAIARACREAGAPTYPELPTGVGFCLYIRRAVLSRIGNFDAATFGRGYGEENDFCLRAAAHGYRNVLCDDAYVVHQGGASFGPLGERPGGENLRRLVARYPRYNALVADFIARDPLAARRAEIAARLSAA